MKRWLLLAGLLLVPLDASAQNVAENGQLLRDAVAREAAGDLRGAELLLRRVLDANPTSLSALLSLERILKIQGKLTELIPIVERMLKADPESTMGHQMLVRAYAMLDDVDDLEKAAETWIKTAPKLETPYREIARVWEARGDYARAIQILEQGRHKIGRDDALALELGDTYADMEEYARAVREWERAIGPDARGFLLVQRRLGSLNDGGAHIVPRLLDALLRSPTTLARRKAAAQLAIDAGLGPRAEEIASTVALELKNAAQSARGAAAAQKANERQSFLVEIARRADGAQLPRLAHWAYSELIVLGGAADQMLALRARMAELALQMGDTARAAESYRALESAYAPGSPQRRQAVALRLQLTVREGKLEDAEQALRDFRSGYPEAPELDAVAATVSNALLDAGKPDRAEDVLMGISGPRAALARGRIALRRGDIPKAKAALLASAPVLHGTEATETIKLANALGRVSAQGGELLGRALAQAAGGHGGEAVAMLVQGSGALPGNEAAIILDFAASIAERNELAPEAEKARRTIIEKYPTSPETPSALLALARTLSSRSETMDEARLQLERLILEHPRSALVPQARQELDRMQGRVPRS